MDTDFQDLLNNIPNNFFGKNYMNRNKNEKRKNLPIIKHKNFFSRNKRFMIKLIFICLMMIPFLFIVFRIFKRKTKFFGCFVGWVDKKIDM